MTLEEVRGGILTKESFVNHFIVGQWVNEGSKRLIMEMGFLIVVYS